MLLLAALWASARAAGVPWICCPGVDSLQTVWYRGTFVMQGEVEEAYITVATSGYADVYVNGRNVSTDVRTPYHAPGEMRAEAVTHDVTPYVSGRDNVVAVWYAPAGERRDSAHVAVWFHGVYDDGTTFVFSSDDDWLCRPASRALMPFSQGETIRAERRSSYRSGGDVDVALWQGATAVSGAWPREPSPAECLSERAVAITTAEIRRVGDSIAVCCFERPFFGYIRVTMRGTKQGERIATQHISYTCSGVTDEQAFTKFVPAYFPQTIEITGDSLFRARHIDKVEAIETGVFGRTMFR